MKFKIFHYAPNVILTFKRRRPDVMDSAKPNYYMILERQDRLQQLIFRSGLSVNPMFNYIFRQNTIWLVF